MRARAGYKPFENQVQSRIVEFLTHKGYVVKSTVRVRRRCWKCQEWPRNGAGDGVTKGLGDLCIRCPSWPIAIYVNGDVKTDDGPLTKEQKGAVAAGELLIWRDENEALADLQAIGMQLAALIGG